MAAVFDPNSADGPEMVENFWPRVRNRGIDAARSEGTHTRRHLPLGTDRDPGRAATPAPPRASRRRQVVADGWSRTGHGGAEPGLPVQPLLIIGRPVGLAPGLSILGPGPGRADAARPAVLDPLVLVYEVDEPPPAAHAGDPYRPLYAALEPEDARRFLDEHVQVPIDASQVIWILAANAVTGIPAPILDRLTVVEVDEMAAGDRVAVLRSVYADANARHRGFFDVEPSAEVLDRLAADRPRRARLAIKDAMTRAAADGRRSVRASDVVDAADRPRMASRRRGMH